MEISNLLEKKDKKILSEMDAYIVTLKQQPKTDAKTQAIAALKRTGVLTLQGNAKKKIVSWE